MSATIGTFTARTISLSAAVLSWSGQETRMMSTPASSHRRIWSIVALASPVGVLVIVWTVTGAPPPTATLPTMIWREGRRSISRQGLTDMGRDISPGVLCAKLTLRIAPLRILCYCPTLRLGGGRPNEGGGPSFAWTRRWLAPERIGGSHPALLGIPQLQPQGQRNCRVAARRARAIPRAPIAGRAGVGAGDNPPEIHRDLPRSARA